MIIRSIVFNSIFYFTIFFFGILFLPFLISKKLTSFAVKFWANLIIFSFEKVIGAEVIYENKYIFKNKGYLIAANHQSAFDTIFFLKKFDKAIYVVKKELKFLPIYGWYAMRLGNIFIDRKERIKSIKSLSKKVYDSLNNNYKVIIFPEGTRQTDNKVGNMKPGIYALQRFCKNQVYPIYIGSSLAWPKNSFIKNNRKIKVKILKPIKCNYTKAEFLNKLQNELQNEHQKTYTT